MSDTEIIKLIVGIMQLSDSQFDWYVLQLRKRNILREFVAALVSARGEFSSSMMKKA